MLPWQPILGLKLALCELQRLHVRLWTGVLVVAAIVLAIAISERVLCFGGVIFIFKSFSPSTDFSTSLGRFSRNFAARRGMC